MALSLFINGLCREVIFTAGTARLAYFFKGYGTRSLISRKYANDYSLSERLDGKGRVKTDAVYVGSYFDFASPERAKTAGRALPWLIAAGWALYVGAMILRSRASHLMYVILPFAFAALTLGFLTRSALVLAREKRPFIRSAADKLTSDLPAASLVGALLCTISLVGEAITFFVSHDGFLSGDIVFCCCCAALAAVHIAIFCSRASYATVEVVKEKHL